MKHFSIDRVEGTKAVLIDDNGDSIIIEAEHFDEVPKEGNVVEEINGFFVFDRDETERRRAMAVERLKMLFERNKKSRDNEE